MKTFNDAAGRTWTIGLNIGTAMKVKESLGVDLLQPEEGNPPHLTRLGVDEILLGKVICALLMGQFEAHKVTEADVLASFDGQTLCAAQKAFYEELIDFFRLRGRADRAKAAEKQLKMIEAGVKAVETKLDGIDIDETIRGVMSGESPAPSASIPGR